MRADGSVVRLQVAAAEEATGVEEDTVVAVAVGITAIAAVVEVATAAATGVRSVVLRVAPRSGVQGSFALTLRVSDGPVT